MKYRTLWIVWIILFGLIEGAALENDQLGDTLSEQIWYLQSVHPIFSGILAAFLGWLSIHWLVRR